MSSKLSSKTFILVNVDSVVKLSKQRAEKKQKTQNSWENKFSAVLKVSSID